MGISIITSELKMSSSGEAAKLAVRTSLYYRVTPALMLLRLGGFYPCIKTVTSDSKSVLKFNKISLAYSVIFILVICSIYIWKCGILWIEFWSNGRQSTLVFLRFIKVFTSSTSLIGYSFAYVFTLKRSKVMQRLFLKWEEIHYNIKLQDQDLPNRPYVILHLLTFAMFVTAYYAVYFKETKKDEIVPFVHPIIFCNATVCVVIPILKEFQSAFKALLRILDGHEPARRMNYTTMIFVADWWLQLKDVLQYVGHWLSPLYIVSGVHMLTIISWWVAVEFTHEFDLSPVFFRHLLRNLFWCINFVLVVITAAQINDKV